MSAEKTLAIVIRRVEFSESSYVTTLFTEDFGKVTGLAKGARRPKSAFENALDLLAVSRVVFLRKSSDAMDLLTEARLERRFRAGLRDLSRLYAGYYVAEMLLALTDEHDPHPALFRSSLQTLVDVDGEAHVADAVLRFELAVLKELGQLPELKHCVECGHVVAVERRVAFGPLAGGLLCSRCKVGQRHVVGLSAAGLELLRTQVTRLGREAGRNMADPPDLTAAVAPATAAARGEIRGLMNQIISHLLGRRPRMHAFLAGLR